METENTGSLSNSLLSATLHDVEIEHVKIINPSTSSVKFQTNQHDHFNGVRKDSLFSDEDNLIDPKTSAAMASETLDQKKTTVQFSETATLQDIGGLQIKTYPLQPNNTSQYITEDGNKFAKQKHKQDLTHKQQQLLDSFKPTDKRHSAKRRESLIQFFEVAPGVIVSERPLSRMPSNFVVNKQGQSDYVPRHHGRAATVSGANKSRVWTGHRSAASSRAISSISSRWKVDDLAQPKPNPFIKMPFKQAPVLTMNNNMKNNEDDIFLPGEDLRATTAFTLSRIRHAIRRMAPPSKDSRKQGRLLKAKLGTLRPVKIEGPRIALCRGVQPEVRKEVSDSPNPDRLRELKAQYLEKCQMHKHAIIREQYKRRRNAHSAASDQSIHRTSPQPNELDQIDVFPLYLNDRVFPNVENNDVYEEFSGNTNDYVSVTNKMAAVNIDSSVIY